MGNCSSTNRSVVETNVRPRDNDNNPADNTEEASTVLPHLSSYREAQTRDSNNENLASTVERTGVNRSSESHGQGNNYFLTSPATNATSERVSDSQVPSFSQEEYEQIRQGLEVMESLFQSLLDNAFRQGGGGGGVGGGLNFGFGVHQDQQHRDLGPSRDGGAPPASGRAIRQLPTIMVTSEDLYDESNRECCICFEEINLGDKVARLHCGHLYHRPCISSWLKKHCTCPICRFELETDDPAYEHGRIERMKYRKPRYHKYELERLPVRELRDLMGRLNLVSESVGITEKSELINVLLNSGKIDVISTASAPAPVEYSLGQLRSMGVGKLKKAMAASGVFFDPVDVVEKEDMVQIFVNSGRISIIAEVEKDVSEPTGVHQPASTTEIISSPPSPEREIEDIPIEEATKPNTIRHDRYMRDEEMDYELQQPAQETVRSGEDIYESRECDGAEPALSAQPPSFASYNISRLRALARELGVDVSDCIEKCEMVEKIASAAARRGRGDVLS